MVAGRSNVGSWAIAGEREKHGAGLLFFALGREPAELHRSLVQATLAARTFREHNPGLAIAIASNNATVPAATFDVHVRARDDLGGGQLARIYWMAHTPWRLTWALDSSVVSCTRGAAAQLLANAALTQLWKFDVAHPSQAVASRVMWPQTESFLYVWSSQVSRLFQQWLLLAMRNGIDAAADVPIHLAELRLSQTLRIGLLAPEFAAAVAPLPNATHPRHGRTDGAAVSAVLRGRAHIVHLGPGADASLAASRCAWANTDEAKPRQLLMRRGASGGSGGSPRRDTAARAAAQPQPALTGFSACLARLSPLASVGTAARRYCLVGAPPPSASAPLDDAAGGTNGTTAKAHDERSEAAVAEEQQGVEAAGDRGGDEGDGADEGAVEKVEASGASFETDEPEIVEAWPSPVSAAVMEDYASFAMSTSCGALCDGIRASDRGALKPQRSPPFEVVHWTACNPLRGKALQYLDRHVVACGPTEAVRSLWLTSSGCKSETKMRIAWQCTEFFAPEVSNSGGSSGDGSSGDGSSSGGGGGGGGSSGSSSSSLSRRIGDGVPPHRPMAGPGTDPEEWAQWERVAGIVRTQHSTQCVRAWGLGISALEQHPMRCSNGGALHSFRLEKCKEGAAVTHTVTKGRNSRRPDPGTHRISYTCIRAEADRRQDWGGGSASAAQTPLLEGETMCAAALGKSCEHLQAHPFACAATHVLAMVHFNPQGCLTPKKMHFSFGCVPLPAATQQYVHLTTLDKASLGEA